jgi:hypothetical protein
MDSGAGMKKVFAAAAFALFWGSPAVGAEFTPVSPLGSTAMDFDTREGAYSYWRVNTVDGINAIRTTFQVHRLGKDATWVPSFTISLVGGANRISFQITSLTRRLSLTMNARAPKAVHNFSTTIGLDQKVDLAFDWTPEGEVSIKAGTETYSVAMGGPVTSVEFYGSTGEIEFDPLQLGRSTP